MAIQAQGCIIRRQSTAAGSTAQSVAATLAFSTVVNGVTRSDVGSFVADGFSSAMRVENTSTSNTTRVHTVASVAATVMVFYEPVITQSTGISITLTGHSMSNVGQVVGFNGPSGSASVIDVTHLGSTAKEKLVGLRDEGQVSLDLIYDPATTGTSIHLSLKDDRATRTKRIFDIKLTDSGTASSQPSAYYFNAYVTGFSLTGAVDDVVKGSVTLEISSAVRTIEPV